MSGVEGIGASGGVAQIINGPISILGVITPPVLAAGATNDYAPVGFAQASILRLDANAAGSTLTGLAGGAANRYVVLLNGPTGVLTLAHQNVGSAAANRFTCPGATNLILAVDAAAALWYDILGGQWHVFSWS